MQRTIARKQAIKISVKEEGWYRITQPELVAAGVNPNINPRYLRLYADGREQPIRVTGEMDRRFDPGDAVEFYGVGLDTPSTDTRVYWLLAGSGPGRRIQTYKVQGGRSPDQSFPYTVTKKERTIYFAALRNGDAENFFGPVIWKEQVDQILSVMHPDASQGNANLEVTLQGVTNAPHSVKVLFNNNEVGEIIFNGQSQGKVNTTISQSLLLDGDNLISFIAQGGEMDVSLIDSIRLTYWHTYASDDDTLKFTASGGRQLSVSGFSNPSIRVIDITNPNVFYEIAGTIEPQEEGYSITFRVPASRSRTLTAFTEDTMKTPSGISLNQPSSWYQSRSGYDMVIISYKDYLENMNPLKTLRESQGLSVALVDVEDIYDEFNFGSKSPQAIKDFLSHARKYWRKKPRFVLLVGDASYDPRNYLGFGDFDLLPTKLVDTVYLETASDDWFVDMNNDGLPDIAIGRLPVHSVDEALKVVSKITGYEQSGPLNEALLVADRVEANDFNFERATLEVGSLLPPTIGIREIFRSSFRSDAEAKAELLSSIDQGPLLVNYTGHGSLGIWRGNILTTDDAGSLINGHRLPFFVNMTCLNGFFHAPYADSLSEALLKASQGGAVAVWTSSGLTMPDVQSIMNKELIRLLFNGGSLRLGEAVMRAKSSVGDQDVRRTWILFGDPTTRLRQ